MTRSRDVRVVVREDERLRSNHTEKRRPRDLSATLSLTLPLLLLTLLARARPSATPSPRLHNVKADTVL